MNIIEETLDKEGKKNTKQSNQVPTSTGYI